MSDTHSASASQRQTTQNLISMISSSKQGKFPCRCRAKRHTKHENSNVLPAGRKGPIYEVRQESLDGRLDTC